MGVGSNFKTAAIHGNDLLVEGDSHPDKEVESVYVSVLRPGGDAITMMTPDPTLDPWTVKFKDVDPPFEEGETVTVVGLALFKPENEGEPPRSFAWHDDQRIVPQCLVDKKKKKHK